jgi:hypothetical protein
MSTKKGAQSLGAQGVEKWNNVGVNHVSTKGNLFRAKAPGFGKTGGFLRLFDRVSQVLYSTNP